MSHHLGKILGISILLATIPVIAQNALQSTPDLGPGMAAFNEGNYQEALTQFEEAESAGNQSDALQYNIAASLYRLGRLDESRQRFLQLADKPEWQVLVRYNLGLVAEAQGDTITAIQYFTFAAHQEENERVRALAREKIAALDQSDAERFAPAPPDDRPEGTGFTPKRWAGLISLSGGEDSNATSLADDLLESANSAEDTFHELLIYGHLQISGRQGNGVRVYGLGFDRAFNTFDHLNSRVIGAGAVYEKPLGDYLFEGGLRSTKTTLDSVDVADQWQLSAMVSRRFAFGTLNTGYSYSRFSAGDNFQQIDGDQHLVEVGWRRQLGDFDLRSRYRYETNARDDLQRGGAFASYSPDRHGIRLEARWQATPAWSTGVVAEHAHSRYDGENRLRDTDGQIREEQRVNQQSRLTADVSYRFNPHWRARAEYQYTDQRDNFDIYDYDKHRLLGTVEFQF